MKRITTLLILIGGLALSSSAAAAPVRKCGNDHNVINLTTRNVSCSDARSFATYFNTGRYPPRHGYVQYPGWHRYRMVIRCSARRHHPHPWPELFCDIRATRTNHVIRFQEWLGD